MRGVVVRLQQMGQSFHPVSLTLLVQGVQEPQEGLVETLTSPITLWVIWGRTTLCATVHLAKLPHEFGFKCTPPIREDAFWAAEHLNDMLPEDFYSGLCRLVLSGDGHCVLREKVNDDQYLWM